MKLEEESYDPAQLDWFDLYRGIMKAGQLLASFELLEVKSEIRVHDVFCHVALLYAVRCSVFVESFIAGKNYSYSYS